MTRPRVVVLGGGFGGLAVVRGLRRADVEVTLVDKNPYNTFSPLLYQVAAAALNPGDITWFLRSVRAVNPRVRVVQDEVVSVDPAARRVALSSGRDLEYDRLVVATGVRANYLGVRGAEEHAVALYGRAQALDLRDRVLAGLEEAAARGGRADLRLVVVGGGATGVETAGAFAELRNEDLPVTHPELDPRRVRITLAELGPELLAPFHPRMRAYARRALVRRGVELRLGTAVREVAPGAVVVERDGRAERLPADIVVWASGVAVDPRVAGWGMPRGRGGRIEVDGWCRVRGLDGVFAVGDVALDPDRPLAQVAQPAMQQGRYVARAIAAERRGRRIAAFRYRDKGVMAVIGRGSAVAEIRFLPRLTGLPAWLAWLGLHIAMLLGPRNRLATMANLATRYLGRGPHALIVGDRPPGRYRAAHASGTLVDPGARGLPAAPEPSEPGPTG